MMGARSSEGAVGVPGVGEQAGSVTVRKFRKEKVEAGAVDEGGDVALEVRWGGNRGEGLGDVLGKITIG